VHLAALEVACFPAMLDASVRSEASHCRCGASLLLATARQRACSCSGRARVVLADGSVRAWKGRAFTSCSRILLTYMSLQNVDSMENFARDARNERPGPPGVCAIRSPSLLLLLLLPCLHARGLVSCLVRVVYMPWLLGSISILFDSLTRCDIRLKWGRRGCRGTGGWGPGPPGGRCWKHALRSTQQPAPRHATGCWAAGATVACML
jgi:hypothetical protein